MLHRVVEYGETRGVVSKPGYKSKSTRFSIDCDGQGNFLGVQFAGEPDDKKKRGIKFASAPDFSFPEMRAGGVTKAQFLLDNAGAVALVGKYKSADEEKKRLARHEYFWNMIDAAAESVPELKPLKKLHEAGLLTRIRQELERIGAKPIDGITFRIGREYVLDTDSWRSWWDSKLSDVTRSNGKTKTRDQGQQAETSKQMVSLLSGKTVLPAPTHEKVGGLPDMVGPGAPLIGFNEPAFESFGLSQSLNAAMSKEEAFLYRDSLQHLINSAEHSQYVCGAQIVYWFRRNLAVSEDPVVMVLEPPALAQARDLLDAARSGKRPDLVGNEYYVLTLSGAMGRVMVRDWDEGSFARLIENVESWLSDLLLVTVFGALPQGVPGIVKIIESVLPVRPSGQKYADWLKPATSLRLPIWRAAIDGQPLPFTALARAVSQHRAFMLNGNFEEISKTKNSPLQWLLWQRMSLLKAHNVRSRTEAGMNLKPALNPEHPSAAYQCGRLMAVLADIQRAALGDVGANIIQRYYAAASTTPALVFGRIVRTAQFHLNKVGGSSRGLAVHLDRQLADVMDKLKDGMPTTLTLEQQSLFALGFYQQIAARPRGKREGGNQENGDTNDIDNGTETTE